MTHVVPTNWLTCWIQTQKFVCIQGAYQGCMSLWFFVSSCVVVPHVPGNLRKHLTQKAVQGMWGITLSSSPPSYSFPSRPVIMLALSAEIAFCLSGQYNWTAGWGRVLFPCKCFLLLFFPLCGSLGSHHATVILVKWFMCALRPFSPHNRGLRQHDWVPSWHSAFPHIWLSPFATHKVQNLLVLWCYE